jgi:hypothetical protein
LRNSIVVILLMTAMATLVWPSPSSIFPQLPEHSAGCHQHGGNAPARGYNCCLTGHNVALLHAFYQLRPAIRPVSSDFLTCPSFGTEPFAAGFSCLNHSVDPGGAIPLRI